MTSTSMNFVADLGGTNVRFALSEPKKPSELHHICRFDADDFNGISDAIKAYLLSKGNPTIEAACIAIAGPTNGSEYRLTNRDWRFNDDLIKDVTGAKRVVVINDFSALANAVPHLPSEHLVNLCDGTPQRDAPILVLGPGTGMGMAMLLPVEQRWHVVATEGGSIGFSPSGALERDVLQHLSASVERVIVEDLLCGDGLELLYQSLCDIRQVESSHFSAAQITENALNKTDLTSIDTVNLFCSLMGEYAGDMALATGALGGVYLGGGIPPRIQKILQTSDFCSRFKQKRKVAEFVKDIPVSIITANEPTLLGASQFLRNCANSQA